MLKFANTVGSKILEAFRLVGVVSLFFKDVALSVFSGRVYFGRILFQIVEIGYYSLPVIALTAIFTGAVLALQTYSGFARFGGESSVPSVVVLSITRELGPVLGGLMVAGRVGASIAAELGTMRVTEQIDALKTLSTNPLSYLVLPRIIAAIVAMPLLVAVADIIGVLGGFLVSITNFNFSPANYIAESVKILETKDVTSGLIKAAFFGFVISFLSCYQGYFAKGGAEGVGRSTTNAVVVSSIFILLSNYFITAILF